MRILLRAAPREDLFGEFSTISEGFVAIGSRAQLQPQTHHSAAAWARAQRTGSSRSDAGLIVQDAGPGQRWLPRERLTAYLRARQAEDRERLRLLTQPLEETAGHVE